MFWPLTQGGPLFEQTAAITQSELTGPIRTATSILSTTSIPSMTSMSVTGRTQCSDMVLETAVHQQFSVLIEVGVAHGIK